MQQRDTICALSSAAGRAGVAVVRVSGPRANEIVERIAGRLPAPRKAALRTIRTPATGEEIDRAIILRFAAPASFTGEDVCEIHPHGGRAVIASVLAALVALGCRLAEPGEFARRAFENGKIDLTQAEGLADLIEAETEAQRAQALRQASGALARLTDSWREELITALALMEAAIDFSDEADVASDAVGQALGIIAELEVRIGAQLADGRRGEILREGFRVVLAGPPNVGKSSVLNALARREAAIVSAEAGTTRDVIEVRLDLAGLPVLLSDTAGIREPTGEIEREGIRRTIERGLEADLVLWLMDGSLLDRSGASPNAVAPLFDLPEDLSKLEDRVLRVINKIDLLQGVVPASAPHPSPLPFAKGEGERGMVAISAVTGQGMAELVERIAGFARERIGATEDIAITQARHRAALTDCRASLRDALAGDSREVELRAEDVRRATQALGRITGRVDAEMVLDQVFGRFCIGK